MKNEPLEHTSEKEFGKKKKEKTCKMGVALVHTEKKKKFIR